MKYFIPLSAQKDNVINIDLILESELSCKTILKRNSNTNPTWKIFVKKEKNFYWNQDFFFT